MIIRLTVNDNDFYYELKGFCKNLSSQIARLPKDIESMDVTKQLDIIRESRKIDKLLNPNVTENHTEEEKELLIRKTKDAFAMYVKNACKEDTADYLIEKFEVEILDTMEDKWENGEAFYWFQHSGVVLNQ